MNVAIMVGASLGLLGGLFGLFAAGWHGLILGGAIGYFLAWLAPQLLTRLVAGKVECLFMDSTFAVMGAMCKVDGQVTRDEISVAEQLFDRLSLFGEARESARLAFERGKHPTFDVDLEVRRFNRATHGQRELVQMFLRVQLAAIMADGKVHPAEDRLLLRVARGLGLSALELEHLKAFLRADQQNQRGSARSVHDPSALDLAYQVLGVKASSSDAAIKLAYRKLMSLNHPDKLAARGLPETMRPMAERRTRDITAAYDRIRAARGDA